MGFRAAVTAQSAMPKSIRIVVPFSPGGSNDVIARAIAGPLAKRLDIPVIVENKAGAAGVVGADFVAKVAARRLRAASDVVELPDRRRDADADAVRPGRGVCAGGDGRTGPDAPRRLGATPFKTPADVVAAARAKPGALNYGTAGVGSIAHLTTELLDDTAKIQMMHVPYKGAANAAVDLAGGQIQVMMSNYSTIAPLMKAGKIKALAVTSEAPHAAFADLPPLATVAPGFAVAIWVGVFAPAGTPAAIVDRLNQEINAIAASPELAPVLEPDGTVPEAISARRVCGAHQGRARAVEADRDGPQDRCRVTRMPNLGRLESRRPRRIDVAC